MTLQPDQELGAYRIVRLLGEGGMGAVYEAEHAETGRHVALKVFAAAGSKAEDLKRRFHVEARLLAQLRHPRLARTLDMKHDERTGLSYFAMDLVLAGHGEPQTLADVPTGELREADVLRWFGELASVLDYIHAEGVVHRDIKLNNILLTADGHVVLTDFGVSHLCSSELRRNVGAARTPVLEAVAGKRLMMGTAGYLAPEVERGEIPTAAADVYALGVLFIYLLTGLWYTPGSKVLGVLEELTYRWDEILPLMVATDPSSRPANLTGLAHVLSVGRFTAKFWKKFRRCLALLLAAVIGGVVVTLARLAWETIDFSSHSTQNASETRR